MPTRDFAAALLEASGRLGAEVPAQVDRRLRARLNGQARPRRTVRWGRVALAAMVAAVALGVALPLGASRGSGAGGFAAEAGCVGLGAAGPGEVAVSGRCTLRDERLGAELAVTGPAAVRLRGDGVEVLSGTVELEVEHQRPRASPYRVRVSHGFIEVLGTHFSVTQGVGAGVVTLVRGSIRFRSDDGQTRLLVPGQSLAWPLAPLSSPPATPAVEPSVAPVAGPARIAASAPVTARDEPELLEEIARLRSRGRYEEAVRVLESALGDPRPPGTRERLSFELGAILTHHLENPARACAHWRRHRVLFPGGRYEREVDAALEELGCER